MWVGFPGSALISMNGMYRPTGGNIDGGTYPADIWGDYMKQGRRQDLRAKFKQPTEPFQSQPFFGHYSREGLSEDEDKDPTSDETNDPQDAKPDDRRSPATTAGGQRQRNGGDDNGGNGGNGDDDDGAFDPGAYETPPQDPPATQDPAGGTGPAGGTTPPTDG